MMAALVTTGLFASIAHAGTPMGPATAYLGEGRWSVSAEYGYEQTHLTASGTVFEQVTGNPTAYWNQLFKLNDLTSHMGFGTLAYGINENWDIFARVGAANAKDKFVAPASSTDAVDRQDNFDGTFGVAWGAGTRATFYRAGPWSFGGLAQFTWFRPGKSNLAVTDPLLPDESWVGDAELSYWQTQLSLAAAYQADKWQIWGGPFVQFVRGDLDFNGHGVLGGTNIGTLRWNSKVEEKSQVGGHVGVNWAVCDQFDLWVEGQITADSWMAGIGAVIMPAKSLGM
jgi:hypothetical protein